MIATSKISLAGGKTVLTLYVSAAILSFIYIAISGTWNGDYIGRERLLNFFLLVVVLVFTILPSIYCFWIFKRNLKYENVRPLNYNINVLRNITWFLFIAHIILLSSGFGVMGTEGTQFSLSPIAIVRSVLLKFSPRLWGIVYLLISNNKGNIKITYLLFIISSLAAHSLGGIYILGVIFIYRYRFIAPLLKRHFILAVIIMASIPALITAAYNFRGQLRGFGNMIETSYTDILFGKLCGRISSISNGGYILESMPVLIADNEDLPAMFYLYDPLHYWGFHPQFKSTGSYVDEKLKRTGNPNSSTMAGPLGVIVMSLAKSPIVFLINLSYILLIIPILFKLLRVIRLKNYAGVGLIISIGYAQNGDSSDIANQIYGLLLMWFIMSFFVKKHVTD